MLPNPKGGPADMHSRPERVSSHGAFHELTEKKEAKAARNEATFPTCITY
jgi:hypothetical protein